MFYHWNSGMFDADTSQKNTDLILPGLHTQTSWSGKIGHTRKEKGINQQQCHAQENKTRGLCCWSAQERNHHQWEREGRPLCAQGVNYRYSVPGKKTGGTPSKVLSRAHTPFQFSHLFHSVTKFIWLHLFSFLANTGARKYFDSQPANVL